MTPEIVESTTHSGSRALKWARRFWVPLLLAAASLGVAVPATVMHTQALSPVDEWVYIDYLYKLPDQGVIRQGETIGQEALDVMACHGVVRYSPMGEPCGSDYENLGEFPQSGKNSASTYTPIYFAATRLVGDALHEITGVDQVTGWRLTSSMWLVAGMLMFVALFRAWKIPDVTTAALGLAVIATPLTWWTYTYVSTDAPSFALGALMLLAAENIRLRRWSGWWLPVISLVAVAIKVTNIFGVGLACLYLVAHWATGRVRSRNSTGAESEPLVAAAKSPPRRWLAWAVAAGLLAVAAEVAWLAFRAATAIAPEVDQGIGRPLTLDTLLAQTTNFIAGTLTANVHLSSGAYAFTVPSYIYLPLSWLTIMGVVGAVFRWGPAARHFPLAISVAVASTVFAPVLMVALKLAAGFVFLLPPRYGLPILPGILLVAALMMNTKLSRWLVLSYATALLIIMVLVTPAQA